MIPAGGPEPRSVAGRCETLVVVTPRGAMVSFREHFAYGRLSRTWELTVEGGRVTGVLDSGDPAPQYMT